MEAAFTKYLKYSMHCAGILHILFPKYKTGLLFLIFSVNNRDVLYVFTYVM